MKGNLEREGVDKKKIGKNNEGSERERERSPGLMKI